MKKAELTASERAAKYMRQVNLRRSVSQKLLRFKSGKSLQEEKMQEEKRASAQAQAELVEKQVAAFRKPRMVWAGRQRGPLVKPSVK